MTIQTFTQQFLDESAQIISLLDTAQIEKMVVLLQDLRKRQGRLFILGVGGGAANSSHAVNDFRKLTGIEAYAPTDNVSELTARANDDGWQRIFVDWLKVSRLSYRDMLLIFSVGGGSVEKNISVNLVEALKYAREIDTDVIGVVGKDGGYTATVATACLVIPTVNPENITPHTEAFQSLVWHLLVSHPDLRLAAGKWETLAQ